MVKPTEKDMIVDLVPTSEGVYPYIPAQDWVESEEKWLENDKDNPMTVDVAQYGEFIELLKESDDSVGSNLQALKRAVSNMEHLIDNSIYYITPAQPVSFPKERE